ncbi:MAG TPA: hypothetical protein VIT44_13890 [Cyclobacteriaceae bacterium]
MKLFQKLTITFVFFATTGWSQTITASATDKKQPEIVVITGTRFTYPLIQKWIDEYNKVKPEVQIIIESRGINDPTQYDILIEAYEPSDELKKNRDYLYFARYAVLPVANNHSEFSKVYSVKGLNKVLIKQIFFHDIFSEKEESIKTPYTVYTRLQKAGAPITFASYFGYHQKDVQGKSIAGSDEHLLKAVLRDSSGVSYFPLTLIYDLKTGKPHEGIVVLPVDSNGNGKVSEDEKFYHDLSSVTKHLEAKNQGDINNVPIEYLNFSIDKNNPNPNAIAFLHWIIQNGKNDLSAFGFLKPEPSRLEKEKQSEFVSRRGK